ncbi:helix-turn-helix domain-containing protein [Sphingomonas sp.]|uniref:helix-turn-helix domain-containing protein n=1 Tax=Sphingomonas sp. TaxID=28214 RepID=UPI003AFFA511
MPWPSKRLGSTTSSVVRISGKADSEGVLIRVGVAIRERRQQLGMSQEALADAARLDRSHMGKVERGERNVTVLNLVRIAVALRSSLSDLIQSSDL